MDKERTGHFADDVHLNAQCGNGYANGNRSGQRRIACLAHCNGKHGTGSSTHIIIRHRRPAVTADTKAHQAHFAANQQACFDISHNQYGGKAHKHDSCIGNNLQVILLPCQKCHKQGHQNDLQWSKHDFLSFFLSNFSIQHPSDIRLRVVRPKTRGNLNPRVPHLS
ncbi:hypothetical protein SDC9_132989 [bioreactor metagenome]|uniref:Uncharacterized protein n=1 Tax=bioreactor metagenome TaxID=1076179 RepID=A0A645D922_9ZZZZ